jgi:hypothetical protein
MIHNLIQGNQPLKIEPIKATLANVTSTSTKTISAEVGLKIMDGFLSGLGKDSLSLSQTFKGVTKISFAFKEVYRYDIDIIDLMRQLAKRKIDVENAVAKAFIDGSMECLLITGVIVSSGFSIKVDESSDGRFAFDVPAIEGLLSAKGNKVQISSANSTDISFKGEKELPFAFEAIRLTISFDGSIDLDNEPDKMFLTVAPEDSIPETPLPFFIEEPGLSDIDF